MNNIKHLIVIASVLIGCGCKDTKTIIPVTSTVPPGAENCEAACSHLKDLNCNEASGSDPKDPKSCSNDCQYVIEEGRVDLKVNCWLTITKCGELESKCK